MARELDSTLHARIVLLSEAGDKQAAEGAYQDALIKYSEAWKMLPEPKLDWEAATWIQSAIGDAWFLSGNYSEALKAFSSAVQSPDGLGNPFIHLRLGECHFELGDKMRAADELTRAYMGAGREIFANESPKYLELLKRALDPPSGKIKL